MNTGEFLFMLLTVFTVTSVISGFRYMIHRIASDEYAKKEKKDLTATSKHATI